MKNWLRLSALLVALALLTAGLALAEDALEIDGDAMPTEVLEAPDALPELGLDGVGLAVVDLTPVSGDVAANAEDVRIDEANFPAADFRSYVKDNFDADGDGALSKAEREAVTAITLRSEMDYHAGRNPVSCATLKGVEHFANLSYLEACDCGLTELDVSGNAKLEQLKCSRNALTKLDLSRNRKLIQLICSRNALKALDLSKNTKLIQLTCDYNRLKALDVSMCTKLDALYAYENQLRTLDVSRNRELKALLAEGNAIDQIDIANCPKVREALSLERKTSKTAVAWGTDGDEGFDVHLSIDRTTRLVAGDEVLYPKK